MQMNSSTHMNAETLAPKTLLRELRDFVNTGKEPKQIENFLGKHPRFLEEVMEKAARLETGAEPLAAVLYSAQIGKQPDLFAWLRDNARLAWKGNEAAIAILLELGFEAGKSNMVLPDWRRSGFRYEPKTVFQAAVYELLKHSREARVCANADCPAPYFIAQDHRRKFCSPDCAAPFQKEWKRRWWERKGKLWRNARKSRSPKRRQRAA